MNDDYRNEIPLRHAVLKIKSLVKEDEDCFFEDMINSESNLISIDFSNGKSLTEVGFSKSNVNISKYYVDFFDDYGNRDIIDYMKDENSNFRVTDDEGCIIRPSINDLEELKYIDNFNVIYKDNK